MNPERFQQVSQLFQSALEREPHERESYLQRACGGDDELRGEVESLLAARGQADSNDFLHSPAVERAAPLLIEEAKLTGSFVGHYQILQQLGAGGMGEVYLAEDTKLNRPVAIKVLPADIANDQDRIRRFVQEAKAAAALNHPNIAHIYEIGKSEGVHFIAMEFIDGQTLRELIHGQQRDLRKLLHYLQQVAEGLTKAHAAGIVHRDLKPDNIMIARDGYAKILDFGLAKLIEGRKPSGHGYTSSEVATALMPQHSLPGTVLGTVGYMSPEQAQGRVKEIDHRSDIFSFGCVLFEAATGQKAFEGKDPLDSLHKIVHAPTPQIRDFDANLPEEMQRIVRRCLAKEPDKRYQSIKDVAIELEELQQDLKKNTELEYSAQPSAERGRSTASGATQAASTSLGTPARSSSSEEYIVGGIRRHKTGALVTLALFLVVGAGVGYVAYCFASKSKATTHFLNPKLTRLTTEGHVNGVTISPDGKYIAYAVKEAGKTSLWTKHLATGSRVQLAPPTNGAIAPATFTRDGSYIYYTLFDEQNPKGTLFQVPVLGGASRRIMVDLMPSISLSPDGKQFAFIRIHESARDPTEDELLTANTDGTNERHLITVREPEWLNPGIAWSPDGKVLAVAHGSNQGGEHNAVATVSIADGKLKDFSQSSLGLVSVAWLPDESGVAVVGRERESPNLQIWEVSFPEGTTRRITNDLNSYYPSLSVTDSGTIVAIQDETTTNLWVAPGGDASQARAITANQNIEHGRFGITWTRDGKLVYTSNLDGKEGIWTIGANGEDARVLTEMHDNGPEVSSDGRYLFVGSMRSGYSELWRMDLDGGNPKQLTETKGIDVFTISPDDHWLIYEPLTGGLYKISTDGGTPTRVPGVTGYVSLSRLSPDGKLLAYLTVDERTRQPKLAVIKFENGTSFKEFNLPFTSGDYFEWSADGRSLIYKNTIGGVGNLWSRPLDGGPAKQITDFKSDLIYYFAYSRDGKQLALARGNYTRDAVLITDSN